MRNTEVRNIFGDLHNTKGPAVISEQGRCFEWYKNGKRHRDDGPAVIRTNEYKEIHMFWFYNGKQKASVVFNDPRYDFDVMVDNGDSKTLVSTIDENGKSASRLFNTAIVVHLAKLFFPEMEIPKKHKKHLTQPVSDYIPTVDTFDSNIIRLLVGA